MSDKAGRYTVNMPGVTDDDYALFNISREILPEADGFQTINIRSNPNAYEWWYFDVICDDGAVITGTLSAYANNGFVPHPETSDGFVLFTYEKEGLTRNEKITVSFNDFFAATDGLDVQAGNVKMVGDYNTFTLSGEVNGIALDLTFTQSATPYRPGNGYTLVGSNSLDNWRGWLNPYPKASVTGTLKLDDGEIQQISGVGYHDHNYGSITSGQSTNGWLWARIDTGRYIGVAAQEKYRQRYDGDIINKLLWIFDTETEQTIIDCHNGNGLTITEGVYKPHTDPLHGGGYPTQTVYQYWLDDDKAVVILNDTGILDGRLSYDIEDAQTRQFLAANDVNGLYYTRRNSSITLKLNIPERNIADTTEGTALHELQESYFPQHSIDK